MKTPKDFCGKLLTRLFTATTLSGKDHRTALNMAVDQCLRLFPADLVTELQLEFSETAKAWGQL